ncbi:MAG: decaprenyl-phosphate phosphoribosyltransferase [Kiritimatiellia bacterium]
MTTPLNTNSTIDTASPRWLDYIRAMRPRQWIKNGVVLAAYFFAIGDKTQQVPPGALLVASAAAALFTLAAAGIYIFNDLRDRAFDRAHPVKCHRPIAAGRITTGAATIFSIALLACGLAGAWLLTPKFALTLGIYVLLQICYTLFLKHIHLVDVFVIAIGFVLRAIGGGLAINVAISPWLIICTFLIALFLALCKRRHEMRMVAEHGGVAASRPNLAANSERLLDQLIAITAGAVVIAYAIYTLWPETIAKFQTHRLYLTLPFVVFGIFRYLDRVYLHNSGGEPESVLLTDIPLLVDIALFALMVLGITYF